MELSEPTRLPVDPIADIERDLVEIDVAIELIRRGIGARVRLSNLRQPVEVAPFGLARCQAAALTFVLDRDAGSERATISISR